MYCGLICHEDAACGDAKCQILQGNIGVCTYPQAGLQAGERAAITYQPFMTEHSHKAAFEEFMNSSNAAFMTEHSHKAAFEEFMKKYEKAYKTAEEKATRFAIFVENRIYVHRANMEKDQTA